MPIVEHSGQAQFPHSFSAEVVQSSCRLLSIHRAVHYCLRHLISRDVERAAIDGLSELINLLDHFRRIVIDRLCQVAAERRQANGICRGLGLLLLGALLNLKLLSFVDLGRLQAAR